jgi:hypothetical protein
MNGEDQIPAYEDALTFEPSEFALAYESVARASMEIAARRRREIGASITGGDSSEAAQRARGETLANAFAPLRERYKDDDEKYYSLVHRLIALAKLLKSWHFKDYVQSSADGVKVNHAVLAAAAGVRLTRQGEFSVDSFLKEVKRHPVEERKEPAGSDDNNNLR